MPEIEGNGHLVIEDGTRDRNSVYIEHEGQMGVGINYERGMAIANLGNEFRTFVRSPEATLIIEFVTASPAVMSDLHVIHGSDQRVQITFDFGDRIVHQFYNCLLTTLNITPVDPRPGELPTLEARIRLEFIVAMPVGHRPQAVHHIDPSSERYVFVDPSAHYPTLSDELRLFPERSREFYKQDHEAKKQAKLRKKKPKALPAPKPLSVMEARFTRIAENLEREDKDG